MAIDAERVEIVFELSSIDAENAAKRAIEVLGLGGARVSLYGEPMSAESVLAKLAKDGRPAFNIEAPDVTIHFSTIRAYQQQLLTIFNKHGSMLSIWDKIVESFSEEKGFTQACLLGDEYVYWQNAADPLQYEASGRSCDGLPMISNGLPSPLEQLVVDTSRNPGRRIIRAGYVEMVGNVMWLGAPFWNLVGHQRRQEVLATTAYRASEMPNGIVRLIASEKPFIDETTEEVQEDLRKLLFS